MSEMSDYAGSANSLRRQSFRVQRLQSLHPNFSALQSGDAFCSGPGRG
jgi:hypothetical protein